MKKFFKRTGLCMLTAVLSLSLSACNITGGKRIVRIAHSQSAEHPDHIGLMAYEKYIEDRLGDKYDVQIFPNELLGPSVKAIELVQTGAVDFAVASTGNLETFDNIYQIFSIPYLFNSTEVYHSVMEDKELMQGIGTSTRESGFEAVAWLDAGTRSFYATTPINTPEDLKGKKIRVQASPTNIKMMKAFGAAASPMNFGDVYTAIQQKVIDGAENNEFALTNNKHGEVAKYYTYNEHQMVPDMLIGNVRFLDSLPTDERAVFDAAAEECTRVERAEWAVQTEKARAQAKAMGVEFIYPDVDKFRQKVLPLHEELLNENPKLAPIYERIQQANRKAGGTE